MTHEVLGGEDAAWLHMEDETNPMVVNGVLELADRLPLERVRSLLESVAAIPRFRSRVVESRSPVGPPRWEPSTTFDLRQHIEPVMLDSPDDAALRAFIGRAVSTLLDRTRPLWHVYVIDRPSSGTTLLYRVHHAIADGFALLGILLSLCEGGERGEGGDARPPRAGPQSSRGAKALAFGGALARIVALPPDPKTLLKGPLSPRKKVAWSQPFALADVKRTAHAANATVNDLLVACASGALGRYLARRGQRLEGIEVRAMVPVDLRGGIPPTALGNHFGLVVLALPVGVVAPLDRLATVKQRMDRLKQTPEAFVTHALLRVMGWVPRAFEALGVWFFGTKASIVLTNVPGPRAPLELAGVRVSRIMFWVPQSGRMGLGISIFSYAGEVTIGVISDEAIVPDPETLIADLHVEMTALQTAFGSGAGAAFAGPAQGAAAVAEGPIAEAGAV